VKVDGLKSRLVVIWRSGGGNKLQDLLSLVLWAIVDTSYLRTLPNPASRRQILHHLSTIQSSAFTRWNWLRMVNTARGIAVDCLDVYALMFEPTDSKLERTGDSKNPI